jgi:hypothetical protein
VEVDTTAWSGDGEFTARLIEALKEVEAVALIRVEDAPASRAGTGYNLLANEIFVAFSTPPRPSRRRWLRIFPATRPPAPPTMTLPDLDARLGAVEGVGQADYSDDGMLQYLRAERVVPPYQTRGYKLVELVRVYRAGRPPG